LLDVKVLGVAGSPRRGGNTETILNEILSGANEADASTEKVVLA
jgi:multimeric flavodoxin WrbA